MRQILAGILAVLSTSLPVSAAPEKPHADQAGFFDDFTHRLNGARWYVSDGWSNGDWQSCEWSAKAVRVRDGLLTLSYIPTPDNKAQRPLCGEVQTNAFLHYGTFEARIRTPRQSGMNASVFAYTGPVHGDPQDEIDIEILTRDPGTLTVNTFVAGKAMNGESAPISPPIDEAFHTVGFRWTQTGITWFLDGKAVHETPKGSPLPDHPQKLFMSFWSSDTLTEWLGAPGKVMSPLEYDIDWVAYTPLDKSCLFPASVTCGPAP